LIPRIKCQPRRTANAFQGRATDGRHLTPSPNLRFRGFFICGAAARGFNEEIELSIQVSEIAAGITPADPNWIERARRRTGQLIMPPRALGRLHDVSERMCGIQRTLTPHIDQKGVLVLAGDHGVVAEGVTAFPQEVTGQMILAFLAGGAGINALAGHVGAQVWVADLGVIPDVDPSKTGRADRFFERKIGRGTANMARGPAMTRDQAEQAVVTGFELASRLFDRGLDVLGTGDMGLGNTTPSAAIGCVVTGADAETMVGRGTGVDDRGLARKRAAVKKAIEVNRPDPADGLDVLAKVGGFEIGGLAGAVLAAAHRQKPVVIDGFISTAGALIAHAIQPLAVEYMFSGHCSEEPGHRAMLGHLGLSPLLDLGMRLGEGTGGALAMSVIEGACRVFRDVMTFEQAAVSDRQ
jgi:nicotinate-nucleotide--dimethylbenzimidazole phosphoribosyltransferase